MSKEAEQPPSPLTLEEVANSAKEMLLHEGFHHFTIIAEGSNAIVPIQIEPVPATHIERLALTFRVGAFLTESQQLDLSSRHFWSARRG